MRGPAEPALAERAPLRGVALDRGVDDGEPVGLGVGDPAADSDGADGGVRRVTRDGGVPDLNVAAVVTTEVVAERHAAAFSLDGEQGASGSRRPELDLVAGDLGLGDGGVRSATTPPPNAVPPTPAVAFDPVAPPPVPLSATSFLTAVPVNASVPIASSPPACAAPPSPPSKLAPDAPSPFPPVAKLPETAPPESVRVPAEAKSMPPPSALPPLPPFAAVLLVASASPARASLAETLVLISVIDGVPAAVTSIPPPSASPPVVPTEVAVAPVARFWVMRSSLSVTETPLTDGATRIPPPLAGTLTVPVIVPPVVSTPLIVTEEPAAEGAIDSTRLPLVCWSISVEAEPWPEIVVVAVTLSCPCMRRYGRAASWIVDPGLAFAAAHRITEAARGCWWRCAV